MLPKKQGGLQNDDVPVLFYQEGFIAQWIASLIRMQLQMAEIVNVHFALFQCHGRKSILIHD